MSGSVIAVDSPSKVDALQRELARSKQEAAEWKHKYFAEVEERKWEVAFRLRKGLKATPKNVAIILRRKWRFPGTKADPNSKVNLDAAGRRLISVQSIADDLDISDTTVRSAIDLLESTGLLFDVVKHGHPKNKYDRVFFRWNEELYRHPDRIDVSQLPKKAGGDQFPPCPGCKTPMETRNVRYARCTNPECEICRKGKELIFKAGKWRTPPAPKDAEQAKEAEPDNTKMVCDAEAENQTKTITYVSTHTPLEEANQNGTESPKVEVPFVEPPEFLRRKSIWCCGRLVWNEKDQRYDKVPFIADMRGTAKASSTNPQTWRTYDVARAVLEKSQSWTGTYAPPFNFLMFMCDGTFTFLDQDHCRNQETGEYEPEALERARKIDSYTEKSWSDDGIHTYAEGRLPPGRRRRDDIGVEMYDSARPCVYTGKPLPGFPLEIVRRQDEIAALHAEVFPPQPAMPWQIEGDEGGHPRTDDELEQLLAEVKDGTPDYSRADAALCRMLTKWAGERCVSTVDWLFRRSKLCRPKWIERADYRERTLRYAFGEVVTS